MKESKIEVNDIPELFFSGRLTENEAGRIIWADVYTNPEKYALKSFDEDTLSDFLLKVHTRFDCLVRNYNGSGADFATFVRNCIIFYKMSYRKGQCKEFAAEETLEIAMKKGFVESALLADYTSDPQISAAATKVRRRRKSIRKIRTPTLRMARDTALVLALKACAEIDDETIKEVASFTCRSESEILEMAARLKEKMRKKDKKREKIIKRRDVAFFRKRRYALELSKLDPNCAEFSRVKKSLDFQTKRWKLQNELLSHRFVKSPKSEEIAEELGLKPRKVFYCISHAQDASVLKMLQEIFKNECFDE